MVVALELLLMMVHLTQRYCNLKVYEPFVCCELRSVFRTMEIYSLGAFSNNLGLLMPRRYAETGFIRKASEERISNRWNKHSSLTQSSQQLKRGKRKVDRRI